MRSDNPTCFFNASRTCVGCAAYQNDGQCDLLKSVIFYAKNQIQQTAVLHGVSEVQNDVVPLVKAAVPIFTKFFGLMDKAMPVLEKLADRGLKELEEEFELKESKEELA